VIDRLSALLSHARHVPADQRAHFAHVLAERAEAGTLVVQTCHRVELYGLDSLLAGGQDAVPTGVVRLAGPAVARHLVRLAVGQDSAVVGEDQVLHQLRAGVHSARLRGPLAPELDRLVDLAMGAGRRARSWLPRSRPDLGSVALARATSAGWQLDGQILVVGAGQMGRLAAQAALGRGAAVAVTSRTPERARALAEQLRIGHVPFDPGPTLVGRLAGTVVALGGPWPIDDATARALAAAGGWLIDLSAPPALGPELRAALGTRLLTIDDLAGPLPEVGGGESTGLRRRLDDLVEATLADYAAWLGGAAHRNVARALADRAEQEREAELTALWQRLPAMDPAARLEVERMTEHLTRRLLREPLKRLRDDGDGRRARAAREFFGL